MGIWSWNGHTFMKELDEVGLSTHSEILDVPSVTPVVHIMPEQQFLG